MAFNLGVPGKAVVNDRSSLSHLLAAVLFTTQVPSRSEIPMLNPTSTRSARCCQRPFMILRLRNAGRGGYIEVVAPKCCDGPVCPAKLRSRGRDISAPQPHASFSCGPIRSAALGVSTVEKPGRRRATTSAYRAAAAAARWSLFWFQASQRMPRGAYRAGRRSVFPTPGRLLPSACCAEIRWSGDGGSLRTRWA